MRNVFIVLGRGEGGDDLSFLDGHLRLPVRPEPREGAIAAEFLELSGQSVREDDAQGKHLLRFARRVAVHDALVARAASIHAHRDIARLLSDMDGDIERVRVADTGIDVAGDLSEVEVGVRAYLAAEHHVAVRTEGFDSDAARRVGSKRCVEDSVGNLIAHFVGVSRGH